MEEGNSILTRNFATQTKSHVQHDRFLKCAIMQVYPPFVLNQSVKMSNPMPPPEFKPPQEKEKKEG